MRTATARTPRRAGIVAVTLIAALAPVALLAPPRTEAKAAIAIQNFAFAPAAATVPVGTPVTWTNLDAVAHTATADSGAFDSGTLQAGQSRSFTPSSAGVFPYHCAIHPNMRATLTVTAAAPPPTDAGTAPTPGGPQSLPAAQPSTPSPTAAPATVVAQPTTTSPTPSGREVVIRDPTATASPEASPTEVTVVSHATADDDDDGPSGSTIAVVAGVIVAALVAAGAAYALLRRSAT